MFHDQQPDRLTPRSAYRLKFSFAARLLVSGLPDADIEVQDLSTVGFMARCDAPVAIGSEVFLMMPSGDPIAADLLWSLGGRIGCRFQRELSREKVLLLFLLSAQKEREQGSA